jgi:hypothetical protein
MPRLFDRFWSVVGVRGVGFAKLKFYRVSALLSLDLLPRWGLNNTLWEASRKSVV